MRVLILLLLLLLSASIAAVESESDELVKLKSQAAKQRNAEAYLYVCEYYVKNGGERNQLNAYLDSAYNAAVKEKSDTWLGQYYTIKGNMYKGGDAESESVYRDMKKKALFHFRKGKVDFILPHLNAEIGLSFFNTNSYDSAIYYFKRGLSIKPPKKDNPSFPIDKAHKNILNFMVHSYKMKQQNDSAIYYGKEMENLCLNIKDSASLVEIRYIIGMTYNDMKKYPENLNYYVKAAQTAEAIKKYNYAITGYRAAASVQEQHKEYEDALALADRSLEYARMLNDKKEMASSLSTIAMIRVGMDESRKAIDIYRESLIYYKQAGDKLSYQLTYTVMVDLFTSMGMQDSAWVYMSNLEKMGDMGEIADSSFYLKSIQELKAKQLIADFAALEEESEKNSIRLQYLEHENDALNQRNLYIMIVACLIAILLSTLFCRQRQKLRNERVKNKISDRRNECLYLLKDTELGLIRKEAKESEIERRHVVDLFNRKVGGELKGLENELKEPGLKPEKIINILTGLRYRILNISKKTKPVEFQNFTVNDIIGAYVLSLNRPESVILNYYSEKEENWPEIPSDVMSEIFIIVKESLDNSMKHALAGVIDVKISFKDKKLIMSVKDNGIGFDSRKANSGIGMRIITGCVENINGEWDIDSGEQGTEIKISVTL